MISIYINKNYEIKAINSTDDTSLIKIEVDREEVFGDKSDFMILNYCYKQDESGYSIYPSRNYSDIVEEDYRLKIDESRKKISILEAENADLLLDSAIKDSKISTLENDLADLTLEIAMMEVR